jgi:uncharacterized protein GlcG (DUF336 family)
MRLINKLIILGAMTISALSLNSRAFAASDYGMSCTNTAYDGSLSSDYLQAAKPSAAALNATEYGVYTGTDCVYAGAGRTNSSAIVGGEIARAAANSIIGAVNGRLSSALAMNNTAAHMSYSSNGNGVGMAANHLVGGLSLWTNFASSSFENDQVFSDVTLDSNAFDGNANSMSFGVDKRFGNIIAGVVVSGFDSDIDTSVNKGNFSVEGETYGVYIGLDTGAISLSMGAGTGEYEVDTSRIDLGSDLTITAKDVTADIQYIHVNVSGTISRGKLSFTPRVGYRNFDMDMPTFNDIVPDDTNTMSSSANTETANEVITGATYSSDMTEAGLAIALSTGGKITPFVDVAYVKEDTTSAAYKTELTGDGSAADLGASAPDGYVTYGGGIMLNLSGKVTGYVNVSETTSRTDFTETSISGSLRVKF